MEIGTLLCTHYEDYMDRVCSDADLFNQSQKIVFLTKSGVVFDFLKYKNGQFVTSFYGEFEERVIDRWDLPIYCAGGVFGRCQYRSYGSLLDRFLETSGGLLEYRILPLINFVNVDLEKKAFVKAGRSKNQKCDVWQEIPRYILDGLHLENRVVPLGCVIDLDNEEYTASCLSEYYEENVIRGLKPDFGVEGEEIVLKSFKK